MPRHNLKPLDDRLAVGKTTLTSRELREELEISPQATSNLLARWQRSGLVDRVGNGRYAIRQIGLLGTRAASEDIALAVGALMDGRTHRIAYHSALDFHGLLTRPVRTIQIATRHRIAQRDVGGRPLRVVVEPVDSVGIGAEPAGHRAFVSDLERTLLDAAARPDLVGGYLPLAEALSGSTPKPRRLSELAAELAAGPAIRRIGSLADQLQIEGLREQLEPLSTPSSSLDLDPGLERTAGAFKDGRWRVIWPASPSEVRQELRN